MPYQLTDELKLRLEEIIHLVYELAKGNFDYKIHPTSREDELDGLLEGINMLGEELKATMVSKNYLESVFQGVVDVLFILNLDFTISKTNHTVSERLGYRESDLTGVNFYNILPQKELQSLRRIKKGLDEHRILRNVELSFLNASQKEIPYSVSFSMIYDNLFDPTGILVIAKDITYFKESEKRLNEAKNKAIQANLEKTRFLANMSHEIRTPLNAILGFTDLLSETSLDEHQESYLRYIKDSGKSLFKLINDILDINKIESGKLVLENIPFDFRNSVVSALEPFKYLAKEKRVDFDYSIEHGIPQFLVGDPSRLNQILRNLVGNSLKFTDSGFVKVVFNKLITINQDVLIEGKVVDTGIGIPEDKLEHIFDAFKQADDSTSRKYGGTGLGLNITRHLLEKMDGAIKVESPAVEWGLDHGSVFTFVFRVLIGDTDQIPNEQQAVKSDRTHFDSPYNILVVDDNELNLKLAKKVLTNLGARVTVVDNGEEVLAIAQKEHFDIALIDIHMPVMDGYILAQRLKQQDFKGYMIALTADAYEDAVKKALEVGMKAHMKKPFTKEEIFRLIDGLMRKGG